jgi:hypothetical protein
MSHGIVAVMMYTLAGAALCAAVYVSSSVQVPDISPVAHEVATVKPAPPEKPDHDDCEPSGVTKNPHGSVHAVVDCGDVRIHHRMDK